MTALPAAKHEGGNEPELKKADKGPEKVKGRPGSSSINTPVSPILRSAAAPPRKSSQKKKHHRGAALVGFFLLVMFPTALVGYYYTLIAADQYQSEIRFAVRGTNPSPLADLGLTAIPGATTQQADSYIVADYLRSLQLLKDLREHQGLDVRKLFSSEDIDFVYRIDPDLPLEEFLEYWNWMIDADHNSTTMITTFRVNAFTGADAGAITAAVLEAAAELVNTLSNEAREQLITNARNEVSRTEDRLTRARETVTLFRNKEQSLDPKQQAASDQELIQGLQKQLIDLRARLAVLETTVDRNSPSIKVINRQIQSLTAALENQRQNIGSGTEETSADTRSRQLNEYGRLVLEQEFAEKAYATAWSSLETATAEARKQERYFAIVVAPNVPDVALYPYRIINTIIAFAVFLVGWLIFYLLLQAIRDHAA